VAAVVWGFWSYRAGGLMRVLIAPPDGVPALDAIRAYVLGWGAWAPAAYVAAVTVEVIVAPIPGTLLYAPAGAIFGGLAGGALSLAGNVIGACLACWLASTFGESWVARHSGDGPLRHLRDRLRDRGGWVVLLLRLNPLTSSDLVSYAAGLAGIPVRQVLAGTAVGMAPLCFAQAYLAQTLFEWLPDGPWLLAAAVLATAIAAWLALRKPRKG
jgi:uncharacterized membrane protein YdjX (TVP38/TMEM64 family)